MSCIGFPGCSDTKECVQCRIPRFYPWSRRFLEKEIATHFSFAAWDIPWTAEPGRLQSVGSRKVGHNWTTNIFTLPLFMHIFFFFLHQLAYGILVPWLGTEPVPPALGGTLILEWKENRHWRALGKNSTKLQEVSVGNSWLSIQTTTSTKLIKPGRFLRVENEDSQ